MNREVSFLEGKKVLFSVPFRAKVSKENQKKIKRKTEGNLKLILKKLKIANPNSYIPRDLISSFFR